MKLLSAIRDWLPSIKQAGFKIQVDFGAKMPNRRDILFGMKYFSGDAVWIEWLPCLKDGYVSFRMKVVSGGLDYSYSLSSVKMKLPFSVSVIMMEHNRIVCSVDSFEGVDSLVTTHEKFQQNFLSFDIRPTDKTDGVSFSRLR